MKNKKKLIIIIVAVLIVIAGTVTGIILHSKKASPDNPETSSVSETVRTEASTKTTVSTTEKSPVGKTVTSMKLDDVNIEYSGSVYILYTYGNIDFCSRYDKDGDGKTAFYMITDKEEKLLTDQNCDEKFVIVNNKIYYTVKENAKKVEASSGREFIVGDHSCWVMNLDGSDRHKIFDIDYINAWIIYADENNVYFSANCKPEDLKDDSSMRSDEFFGDLCRFSVKDKKVYVIESGTDYAAPVYQSGYIFYTRFSTYFGDCMLKRYTLKNGMTEEFKYLAPRMEVIDDDTLILRSENGDQLYSISKNTAENLSGFPEKGYMILGNTNDGVIVGKENGDGEINGQFVYGKDKKLKKITTPENENAEIDVVFSESELIYHIEENDGDSRRFLFYYMKDGKLYELDGTGFDEFDSNCFVIVTGQFESIIYSDTEKEYYTFKLPAERMPAADD